MENVTKIDIMVDTIYCYDELTNERIDYPLTSEYDFFINEFSDTQELLTVNISDPIARVMKFYTIENSVPKSFTELDYVDMTEEQKVIFDAFVEMIKAK
jgi:glutamine synthetase type III